VDQKIIEKIYSSLILLNALKHIEYTLAIMEPKCDKEFAEACIQDLVEILDAISAVEKMISDGSYDIEQEHKTRKMIETDPLFVIIEERLGKGMLTIN
jgi:hypothetical protein